MKKLYSLYFLLFFVQISYGQQLDRQVFGSNGNSIKAGNLWLDYTIGEMEVVTYTSSNLILNQGFQQVYNTTISVFQISPSYGVKVYPNPASDYLYIDIPDEMVNTSFYKLTDITGRLISGEADLNPVLSSNNTTLNISDLSYGIYLLSIQIPKSASTHLFRIIKL